VGDFIESMMGLLSAGANNLWREQNGEDVDDGQLRGLGTGNHAAKGRPGHTVAKERLADMDFDGIASSITYCEVSAFRYLFMLKEGSKEATRAFNTTLEQWASEDPDRLHINFQIPIHDIDAAVAEVKHAAEVGVKSIQLPVYPAELGLPDYWDERYIPLLATIEETGIPIALHIGLNTTLDARHLRADGGIVERGRDGDVAVDRYLRALPAAQDGVRRTRRGVGQLVALHRR
jgi:predicted TIM-barrel fold metal-dependent hydrolase